MNISEGCEAALIATLGDACAGDLLDVHSDVHHNRSVFTLVGEDAPRALATRAVEVLDIGRHEGVHPRIGVVDVVPFVPLAGSSMADAVAARDRFARWFSTELGVPCFLYGEERSLPEVRRDAWRALAPDTGGDHPHPTAGACAVGARQLLVAYNLWLAEPDLAAARTVATKMRSPEVRALGLDVGGRAQLSMNLIAPLSVGPAEVEAQARRLLRAADNDVAGAELVGLVPEAVLNNTPRDAWERLDLSADTTIEARLRQLANR